MCLLAAKTKAEPSYIGIALLVAAAIVMPWFGHEKRRLAAAVSSGVARGCCSEFYLRIHGLDCTCWFAVEQVCSLAVG
jgi:hypothetical protein